jgi:hypothetical protein
MVLVPVSCWLCGHTHSLEYGYGAHGGRECLIPMINCDKCGCLLDSQYLKHYASQQTQKRNVNKTEIASSKPVHHRCLGWVMSGIVTLQVTVVFMGNLFVLLPGVLFSFVPPQPNTGTLTGETKAAYAPLVSLQCVAIGLFSTVMLSYWAVIWSNSGRVMFDREREGGGEQEFLGYTWCHECDHIKPPEAHHCRRCNVCVYKLDHHCIYTGNKCIGQDNIVWFVRFLKCLLLGAVLSSLVSIMYAWTHHQHLSKGIVASRMLCHTLTDSGSGSWQNLRIFYHFFTTWLTTAATFEDLVWIDTCVASIAASIGSFILLLRQLRCMQENMTHLEIMIMERNKQPHQAYSKQNKLN